MDCELDSLMFEAWERVGPGVLADEDELRARLARRRATMFTKHIPRALCAAVRAADRRITPFGFVIDPEVAVERGSEAEHEVTIATKGLRDLCWPVRVNPGERARVLQRKLGVEYGAVTKGWKRGELRVNHYWGLGGQHGARVAVVFSDAWLDPGARAYRGPDRLLEPYWRHLSLDLPEDLKQTLIRQPAWTGMRGRKRLIGWRWICPGCKTPVRTVYYPIGIPDFAAVHEIKLPAWARDEVEQMPVRPGCFACRVCHGTMGMSWATPVAARKTWEYMISYFSGGLLYGSEVAWPGWLKLSRKVKLGKRDHGDRGGMAG